MSSRPRSETDPVSSLSTHILPTSANLLGVCIMSLSLVKLMPRHGWSVWIDEALALDGVVFLLSVALSYASLRFKERANRLENWAEMVFLFGLSVILLSAIVLAFTID